MRNKFFTIAICICAAAIMTMTFSADASAKAIYKFGGGPAGGTFQFMAGGIATYPGVKSLKDFRVLAGASGGSTENLRKVNSGSYAFGVSYSGDIYLGRNGQLANDENKYDNVMAVAFFYGAPAQLIVKKGGGINSVKDLVDKKVGVGNAGSGAFATCERFFRHMGVWEKIERNAMGYNDAAAAFGNNQLDAFWLFTAFPSGAVTMAAQQNDIDMIDLYADAKESGFFEKFPYFAKLIIPAGTYKGVDRDIPSFQDSALWTANKDVPADVVYKLLSLIYTPEGLAHMVNVNKKAKSMSIESGITGVATPLHPGAEKFWKEKGVLK
ncbi:TAXI family TRAP transporter solute-binding subunit [uncultured Desulfosarcina sp.]|uniref:TAXI family TRAP transporter solute-binding subunit n=1 Tax=uncultured Desulfosarcina sp. TaxID=218289 RepID=UPI0029C701F3|nr:TAXI family TRAP transporter solute-binding subunit [uncultured Desulfosarcina sp.]